MPVPADIPSRKAALRREMAARVAAIDPVRAREAARRVADAVVELPEIVAARRVLACLSFGDEIDTWGLVEHLLASGREVYVPRADARDGLLHVHRYPCPLKTLPFGLQQPPRGTAEVPPAEVDATLDAVLVLGLAFDRRGYRLGHGSGYFDRFLPHRPFPAVALAYGIQRVERLPTEAHDVPMSLIVTELETLRPAQ